MFSYGLSGNALIQGRTYRSDSLPLGSRSSVEII